MDCLLWIVLCLAGSIPDSSRARRDGSNEETERARAQSLMAEFWNWHLREFPEFATEIGISDYDDRVTEHTEDAFKNRMQTATQLIKAISDVHHAHLDHMTRLDLLVMEDSLSTYVEGFRFRFLTCYQRFQMGLPNPVSEWSYILSRQRFNTEQDYIKLLVRYSLIPKQFEQLLNLTALAVDRGYMRNTDGIERYTESLAAHMVVARDTIFFKPFLSMPADISKETANTLQKKAERLIHDKILPAIWKMWFFVLKTYSKAAEHVPIGMYGLSEGKALYRRYLNFHLSLPMTPEQVHQIGLVEIRKVKTKIAKLQKDLNFTGNLGRFVQFFVDDPKYYFNDSDAMLVAYGDMSKLVKRRLNKVLTHITNLTYETHPTYSGPPGSFTESFDPEVPPVFYANVGKPYGPSFTMPTVLLHETAPGHFTEATYLRYSNRSIPTFRQALDFTNPHAVPFHFPIYSAYIEGWGLYAESLGEELGLYDNKATLLGYYLSEMLRASRLIVDTGIHAYGWSRRAAEDFLGNHTHLSTEDIKTEVSRYLSRPGQACSYKIGEMKIRDLLTTAKQNLGEHFDLRQFHHRLLSLGPVPLQLLEEEMHTWVTQTLEELTFEPKRGGDNDNIIFRNSASKICMPFLQYTLLYLLVILVFTSRVEIFL